MSAASDVAYVVLGVQIEGAIEPDSYHVMRAVRQAIGEFFGRTLGYSEVAFEVKPRGIPAVGVRILGTEDCLSDKQALAEKVGKAVEEYSTSIVIAQVMEGGNIVGNWCSAEA